MASLPRGFTRKKSGNRKAALLLHGMSSSPWEMSLLSTVLSRSGWDVFCPLLANFNSWEGRFNGFSWEYWFNAAQQALGPMKGRYRRTAVVGTSLGGVLAGLLCARNPWLGPAVMVNPPFRYRGFLVRCALLLPGLFRRIPVRVAPQFKEYYFPYFPIQAVRELREMALEAMKAAPQVRQPVLVYYTRNDRTISESGIVKYLNSVPAGIRKMRTVEKGPHSLLAPSFKNNNVIADGILQFIETAPLPRNTSL